MKRLMVLVVIFLIASCSLAIESVPGETPINGVWSGWVINANGATFRTPIGIKTINYPVQIIQRDERWYIWESDMEIYPLGEN